MVHRYIAARKDVMDPERLKYAAQPILKFFGDIPVDQITEQECRNYTEWREKAPGTVRRELGLLASVLRMGGYTNRLWRPDRPAPKQEFLSKEDAKRLLSKMSFHVGLFTRIALSTGQRKSAVLGLTWDRVDLERKILDFNEPGRRITKKRRAVTPIGNQLRAALANQKEVAFTDHVIEWDGKPVANIKKGFNRAAKDAGVPWCTPHTLKHTAISWLAEADYSIDQISDMTATDQETVKRIYRKFNPNYLRDIADHMDMEVFDEIQSMDKRRKNK